MFAITVKTSFHFLVLMLLSSKLTFKVKLVYPVIPVINSRLLVLKNKEIVFLSQ